MIHGLSSLTPLIYTIANSRVLSETISIFFITLKGCNEVERYLIEEVYSVDHVIKEVSNAIWKHNAIYRKIIPRDARELYRALLMLLEEGVVVVEPDGKYIQQAFEIAHNREITVYNALYVA